MPSRFDTRRTFLKLSAIAAVSTARRALAWPTLPAGVRGTPIIPEALPGVTDPDRKALSLRALDAAKSAGATYADVRTTVTRYRTFLGGDPPVDREVVAVGVRALARGAWGFAATTDWSADIMAELGTKAARQAQLGVWKRVPPITLADRPAPDGHWEMPVTRDPWTVPIDETTTVMQSAAAQAERLKAGIQLTFTFQRQERTFASTDGGYTTQTVYTTFGAVPHADVPVSAVRIAVQGAAAGKDAEYSVPLVTPTGAGYEALDNLKLAERLPEWIDKARAQLPATDFTQLGQYPVVFDGAATCALVDATFGAALEYDRVVGYEANAGGTSYLAPPRELLGTRCAPDGVTVTADRTLPGGVATVRWDDDGVAPAPSPLIERGVLVDYATSREFVPELTPWYQQARRPIQSNGCAGSESALTVTLVQTPNLVLHPGIKATTLDDLIATVDNGMVVYGGSVQMDFQQMSGRGTGAQVFLVKHGKIVAPVKNAAYTFRSRDLWKDLVALGGAQTTEMCGLMTSKGQPNQVTLHSVRAVATRFDQVQVTNAANA